MSKPIEFNEEFLTPTSLAKALGKQTAEILRDLKTNGERAIYTENVEPQSPLPWGVVQRTCERAGYQAKDTYEPTVEVPQKDWAIIKNAATEAASFHRTYGASLKSFNEHSDPAAGAELLLYHNSFANAIDSLIKKLDITKRPLEASEQEM